MAKHCEKRQVERTGSSVLYRCIHKHAPTYRQHVDSRVCSNCPLWVGPKDEPPVVSIQKPAKVVNRNPPKKSCGGCGNKVNAPTFKV